MKFTAIIFAAFTASVVAKNGCGFPDGPDCKSLGRKGADGLEQFQDDGCCVFPARCGNGDGGQQCELVGGDNVKDQRGRRRRHI
ncbi:hypothetical protein LX36DRAFT_711694 [Colletotrichum falcatum]|nr:hypothetical protein LX36DRAFT_711694 [Colletotrichum falcatum]